MFSEHLQWSILLVHPHSRVRGPSRSPGSLGKEVLERWTVPESRWGQKEGSNESNKPISQLISKASNLGH